MTGEPAVAHVVPYYPPHDGGMERVAAELVRALPAWGVPATVITSDVGVPGTRPAPEPGVTRLPTREVAHTPLMRGLVRALQAVPANVLHVHVAHAFVPDVAGVVARRRNLPLVVHYHLDVDPTGPAGVLLLRPYQRTLLRWTLRRADAVVAPTPDYARIVRERFGVPAERVHVLPNGTSMPLADTPRTAPAGRWRLLSVGRLNDQKNHALLLAALARLRELAPGLGWTLDVYGDGELRDPLAARVRELGLGDRVTLRGGGAGPDEMRRAYDDADLFVLATRKESFGIVYAEAMARGVPVVTTDVPGVRDVVRDGVTGLLAPQTADGLAAAVLRCTGDASRYARLSAAGLDAVSAYRWPAIAGELAGLYRSLTRDQI